MYNQIWHTLHLDALKITETKACNNNLKTKRNNSVPSMDLTRRKGERGGGETSQRNEPAGAPPPRIKGQKKEWYMMICFIGE